MSNMSGYDTIKELKANPKTAEIPVIFLTEKSDAENEEMGLSLGAVDFFTKPFSPPLLHNRIEMHFLLQSQKNEIRRLNEKLVEMDKT
jgi:putative two-component system response regulator